MRVPHGRRASCRCSVRTPARSGGRVQASPTVSRCIGEPPRSATRRRPRSSRHPRASRSAASPLGAPLSTRTRESDRGGAPVAPGCLRGRLLRLGVDHDLGAANVQLTGFAVDVVPHEPADLTTSWAPRCQKPRLLKPVLLPGLEQLAHIALGECRHLACGWWHGLDPAAPRSTRLCPLGSSTQRAPGGNRRRAHDLLVWSSPR